MSADITAPPPPQAPPAPEQKSGVVQRMIGVLFSPNETLAEIARKPDVLLPLVILFVVTLITTVVVVPRMDFDTMIRDQLAQSGRMNNMSPEDADRMIRFSVALGKALGYASPLFAVVVWAIIAGALLISFRLFGGEGTFKQAFSVTLYAWVPLMIKGIITTIVVAAKGMVGAEEMQVLVRSNPAFLVDFKAHPVLFSLLTSFDIFGIWTVILLIIGFSYLSRLSKAMSAAIVIAWWAIVVVVKVGFAAMGAAKAAKAAAT